MTDLAPGSFVDPGQAALDNTTTALEAAPELQASPGAALNVGTQGGNVTLAAQVTAQAAKRQTIVGAANTVHQSGGFLGSLGHIVEDGVGDLAKAANAPLQLVQHEYRYLHDVEARHGMWAAALEGTALITAAAAGTVLTGGLGDVLAGGAADAAEMGLEGAAEDTAAEGAEKGLLQKGFGTVGKASRLYTLATKPFAGAAVSQAIGGAALGQLAYNDSWKRTSSSTYVDPHTHQSVSFGRDIMSGFFHLRPGTGAYKTWSGVSDGLFDIFGDPLQGAGHLVGDARSLEGMGGLAGKYFTGRALTTSNIDLKLVQAGLGPDGEAARTFAGNSVRRALDDIASSSPAEILRKYPRLAPIISDRVLTNEEAADDELRVFRHDPDNEPEHDPAHPAGAFYTPEGAPSSYAARGSKVTQVFAKKANVLNVAADSGNPDVYNAATATIAQAEGTDTLHRLLGMDPRQVADEVEQRFGTPVPKGTDPIDAYGAALARSLGHKAVAYAANDPTGYGDEFWALDRSAVRAPGSSYTVKGLASAKTPTEVGDVLRRAAKAQESIGSEIPTLSNTKRSISQLRSLATAQPVQHVSPFAGLLRHPLSQLAYLTTYSKPAFDEATRDFFTDKFFPSSMRGVSNLQHFWTQGVGSEAADHAINAMYEADLPGRHTILRNMYINTIFGHAGLDSPIAELDRVGADRDVVRELSDPKFAEAVQRAVDEAMLPMRPEGSALYGSTLSGEAPPPFVDAETGVEFSGALVESQRGAYKIPSVNELHRVAQELTVEKAVSRAGRMVANARLAVGSVDDFTYNRATNPIKALLLQTFGYATRMAAAEQIPNALRLGARRLLEGGYYAALKDLAGRGVEAAGGDASNADDLVEWVQDHYDRLPTDPKKLKYAMTAAVMTEGNGSTRGLATGENIIDSREDDMEGRFRHVFQGLAERNAMRAGEHYTMYPPTSDRHLPSWQVWLRQLGKNGSSSAIAKELRSAVADGASEDELVRRAEARAKDYAANEMDPETRDDMVAFTHKVRGATLAETPTDTWAHQAVENVRAAVTSPRTGEINQKLLDDVANGRYTSKRYLASIDAQDAPKGVPGRVMVPHSEGVVQRIAGIGFRRVLNPYIQATSRSPLFTAEFVRRMEMYEPMMGRGEISYEDAAIRAASDATQETIKYVHNTRDRILLAQLMRNWMPFFFAQEQAYRRAGRLLLTDPGAFRQYQLMITGAHNLVANEQDAEGNQYIAFPGSGFISSNVVRLFGFMGIPTQSVHNDGFGGTLSSANVVFPLSEGFRPDLSPLVVAPMSSVANAFREFGQNYSTFRAPAEAISGALSDAVGPIGMNQPILQQLLPNQVMVDAVQSAGSNTFNSVLLNTLATMDYEQRVAEAQWIKDGRRGPAPTIAPADNANPLELQRYVRKVTNQTRIMMVGRAILEAVSPLGSDVTVQDFGLRGDLTAAIQKYGITNGYTHFLQEHPYATAYTTAESTTVDDTPLKESAQSADWVQQHYDAIQKDPAILWLMPQSISSTYDSAAYQEQVADELRTRDTPEQFLTALYTSAGDQTYYSALAIHESNVAAAGKDTSALNQEYANWDAYMQQLQTLLPVWWQSFSSGTKASAAAQTIQGLKTLFASGAAPKGQQSDLVQQVLNAYEQADAQYQAANNSPNYSTLQKQIRDNWELWTTQVAQETPQLKPIIDSVFRDALYDTNQT